jgi:hypothetical protein
MNLTDDRIYQLLPAFHRVRDAELGYPLRALIGVLGEQARVMEADIAQLYDNGFIETCAEWVVPYHADLLGVRGLHDFSGGAGFSQRGRVANAIAYRRRRGTAAVLEQLAFDTTGWRARAVEFFNLLEWTQHQNHIRPQGARTPDLRNTAALELLDGPFDSALHLPDVRNIRSGRGRHNLPNIGIFLWRLASYALAGATARAPAGAPAGGFTFDCHGRDLPLFNRPQTEAEITHLAEEINVPGPLRRRPLHDELEARRQALASGMSVVHRYFDDRPDSSNPPVLQVFRPGTLDAIPAEEMLICHLGEWSVPPDHVEYPVAQADGSTALVPRPISVAVDPVLGRLIFPASAPVPEPPRVSYSYGFSADLGGGPYNRFDSVRREFDRKVTWPVAVSRDLIPVSGQVFPSLAGAIDAWNLQPPGEFGVIVILDSATYSDALTGARAISIPEGSRLLIVAADWPQVRQPGGLPGLTTLAPANLDPDGVRPHLLGNVEVHGTAPLDSETPGELVLNGLLLEGGIDVTPGNLGRLSVDHSTVLPGQGGIVVTAPNPLLKLSLMRAICGAVTVPAAHGGFSAVQTILDVAGGAALDAPQAAAVLRECTVFGEVRVQTLEAENSIFNQTVQTARRQTGCVRFCYLPNDSQVPRRYRCQPALALESATSPAEEAAIERRLRPSYTARAHGQPAYAQLGAACPVELQTGADDGSEMGAFRFLKQPQREANLRASLEPFLRFALEAGLLYAT